MATILLVLTLTVQGSTKEFTLEMLTRADCEREALWINQLGFPHHKNTIVKATCRSDPDE